MVIGSTIIAVFMMIGAMVVRVRSSKKPASIKKIVLPPLFMSTGSLMYLSPIFRMSLVEMLEATVIGIIFGLILNKITRFEIRNGEIYLKRTKSFFLILGALLIVRVILKYILGTTIDYGQLSGMFFWLAFSMIVTWRVTMFIKFKKTYETL
ncbi:MAG: rane protein [Bacillales bacterium]|nr:rane protein [Bacillales bacterium]